MEAQPHHVARAAHPPQPDRMDDLPTPSAALGQPGLRVWVLGSGSGGNAVAVAHGERLLLLDAGFELPILVDRLRQAGLHPWFVEEVVLTHGHRDHVLGAAAGARLYGWRVWASLGTVWRWRALRHVGVAPFTPGETFDAGPFRVRTAPTPHDVDDSAALVVAAGGAAVGYCTDLGHAPDPVVRLLTGLDALVLESNYDADRLRTGPYPPELQARVGGPTGHLGNAQAAELARAVAHPGLRHLVLAHISRHNNTPDLALDSMRAALAGTSFGGVLHAAPQDTVLGPLDLAPNGSGHVRCTPDGLPLPERSVHDDPKQNDKSEYLNTGFRDQDGREGFGDDKGTRVGRPDSAQPAPLDASGGSEPGQAGTNSESVDDGLEGSILEADGPQGPQQSRVQAASEGVNPGRAAGDERRVFDL
jgi:phosphoribosyl 1,2-cyclic phosphodiesterase